MDIKRISGEELEQILKSLGVNDVKDDTLDDAYEDIDEALSTWLDPIIVETLTKGIKNPDTKDIAKTILELGLEIEYTRNRIVLMHNVMHRLLLDNDSKNNKGSCHCKE